MTAIQPSWRTRWRHIAGVWLALAVFDASQTIVSMLALGHEHAWLTLFWTTMASWAVWPLCTPLVLALLRRFPLPGWRAAPWGLHAALCLAIGLAWALWSAVLEYAANPFAYAHDPPSFTLLWKSRFVGNLIGNVILYGAIVVLSILLAQQAARARLAESLAQAQLAALKLQLEPHFVFNALNAVTGLIREQRGNDAIVLVTALGDLLRHVTERPGRQFTTLEEEAQFLRRYLDIQQFRFAERLRCQVTIPAALMGAQVPDFILQPLVENAVKHGIARRAKGGRIQVDASRDGDRLTLSVRNDGPALPQPLRDGVGLANTRQRLAALYGSAGTLALQDDEAGVLATISLPYREA